MPEMYAASVILANGRQLPTFYLLSDVHGIVDESQAAAIVSDMLAAVDADDASFHVVATSFAAHTSTSTALA